MNLKLKSLKKIYDLIGNDSLRSSILRSMESFGIRKDIIRLDANDVCNIECIMCYNRPQICTPDRVMSFDNFKILIDRLSDKIRLLYLSCQHEPLMTKDFEKYLSYAKSKEIPFISFATNGLLLNENLISRLVEEKIDEIIISFNGPDKEDYNRIMFRSSYDLLIKNLNKLRDVKKEKKSVYPSIRLNMILMKSNLTKFDRLMKFAEEYDVDTIQFRELDMWEGINNPEEIRKEKISNIEEKELEQILEEIYNEAKKLSLRGKQIILPVELIQNKHLREQKEIKSKKSCCTPYFSYWITHDGTISTCRTDENSVAGNIFSDPLEEIFKRRDTYRKLALAGKCKKNCLCSNIDSSQVI